MENSVNSMQYFGYSDNDLIDTEDAFEIDDDEFDLDEGEIVLEDEDEIVLEDENLISEDNIVDNILPKSGVNNNLVEEDSATYTTYNDIDTNKLNNIIIYCKNDMKAEVLVDFEKITPLCNDYLNYVAKKGYYPDNETFEEFCKRTIAIICYDKTEKELLQILNTSFELNNPNFTVLELNSLAQYLSSVRNIELPANLLQYYINYPLYFFKCIGFPFRKASFEEIRLISECYQEPWYRDYIVPLFSLESKDTELIIKLMQNGEFNENEAVQYTGNLNKLFEYLKLKLNGGYAKDIFDTIGNNPEDMELYNIFAKTVGDADIAKILFAKSDSEKLAIANLLQDITNKNKDGKILTTNGHSITLVDFIARYEKDPYFVDLLKGVSNGIFNQEIYKSILLVQPNNKQITSSLLFYYATQPGLVEQYNIFKSVGIAIAANDIKRFGYDYSRFSQALLNNQKDDVVKVLTTLVCMFYSELFEMSPKDYKQWLALFSQDCIRYVEIVNSYSKFDFAHFNKFWAAYTAHYFGFDDVNIDTKVTRFAVLLVKEKSQSILPLDLFIYLDSTIDTELNAYKSQVDFVTYDETNNLLVICKRKFYGKHRRPFATLKTSLEFVGESETISDYSIADKTKLIRYFNMLSIGNNIDRFCEKDSSLYEADYKERADNFVRNSKAIMDEAYIFYNNYDAIFYIMSQDEVEYSLLMYCNDVRIFANCLQNLRKVYYYNSNSLALFTNFITYFYKKHLVQYEKYCNTKTLIVHNDARINQMYGENISFEIFLKDISHFYKMADEVDASLSVDSESGALHINYKLQ